MQHRVDSLMEAVTNTAIGFVISLATFFVIAWAYQLKTSWFDNIAITGVFTVISILRQYILRRLFNGRSPWAWLKTKLGVKVNGQG